jgi:hypothetical protein
MERLRRVPWVVFESVAAAVVMVGLCAWVLVWTPTDEAVKVVVRPSAPSDTIEVAVGGRRLALPVRPQFDRRQSMRMALVLRDVRRDSGGTLDPGARAQLQGLMRTLLSVNSASARILVDALCRPGMPADTFVTRSRPAWVRRALTARASLVSTQADEVMAIAAALRLLESGPQERPWRERLAALRPDLAEILGD